MKRITTKGPLHTESTANPLANGRQNVRRRGRCSSGETAYVDKVQRYYRCIHLQLLCTLASFSVVPVAWKRLSALPLKIPPCVKYDPGRFFKSNDMPCRKNGLVIGIITRPHTPHTLAPPFRPPPCYLPPPSLQIC